MEPLHMTTHTTEDALPLPGRGFWSEGTEAIGTSTDACPLVTHKWMVAASGGLGTPVYAVDMGGMDGLYDTLFGELLPRCAAHDGLLAETFADIELESVAPVARYAAVLAEASALAVLGAAEEAVLPESLAERIAAEVTRRVGALRGRLAADGMPDDPALYAVRLTALRVCTEDEGLYYVDTISAGPYHLYLLDAEGMHALGTGDSPLFAAGESVGLTVRRTELIHPEPFALLLLSEAAVEAGEAVIPGREPSGLVWRHRMRLEEAVLHLLTACLREGEFGDRAAKYFAGHIRADRTVTGALLVGPGEGCFEALCEAGRTRLSQIEELLSLLPEDYHPATAAAIPSRSETVAAYLGERMAVSPALADRAADLVYMAVLRRLRDKEATGGGGHSTSVGGMHRSAPVLPKLTDRELGRVYAVYRADDKEDLDRIEENERMLDEVFMAHWVTWRPILAALARTILPPPDADTPEGAETARFRAARDRDHAALLLLNARLGEKLAARRQALGELSGILTAATDRLHIEQDDWLSGRGGDDNAMAWAGTIMSEVPQRMRVFRDLYRADTERYRSLLMAYRSEREWLFLRDNTLPHGFLAALRPLLTTGRLSEAQWAALATSVTEAGLGQGYLDRLEAIRRITAGTAVLHARMERRGADRRTARELSLRADLRVAALCALFGEDPVEAVLSTEERDELATRLALRDERARVDVRQREAFEAYRSRYLML